MRRIELDKDAFVGVYEFNGIKYRAIFLFPSLRFYAWRLDKPGLALITTRPIEGEEKEDEGFEIEAEASGFHQDEEGYWVKPNGDSVLVFFDKKITFEGVEHVFEKYFPKEYKAFCKIRNKRTLKQLKPYNATSKN